eukprot:461252-Amphidinium_carterae.1
MAHLRLPRVLMSCAKVVEIFVAKKESLEESGRRQRLLAAFRKVKHTSDSDFIEYLMRQPSRVHEMHPQLCSIGD